MSLSQILDKYQRVARDQREKGALFEQLMQRYLKTDPIYANELTEVWLWEEFPFRKDFGGKDLGIDLVAKTVNNEYWAIQCKFYDVKTTISLNDISTFLSNSGRIFQDENGQTARFSLRLWIDTKVGWGKNASEAVRNQQPEVKRLGWYDLATAAVDWEKIAEGKKGHEARAKGKTPRKHQLKAIDAAHEYFKTESRGKFIMACGTGKTYTALNVVERETNKTGFALFLVPSIALLSQTLREWMNDTSGVIYPVCICSDASSSKIKKAADLDDTSTVDLPYPATTDLQSAMQQLRMRRHQQAQKGGMVIIFSTYQSIEVVHNVQKRLLDEGEKAIFDIIVCDEAHRTTGVLLKGKEKSNFVRVHDNDYLPAVRRLYMTATPKLYQEEAKKKASQAYAVLCSMDDENLYGKEIYHLGFGKAVENGLLSDYKVLVLTIGEDQIPPALQSAVSSNDTEINTDDAAKLIGCINALSKRMTMDKDSRQLKEIDPGLMHTALAFCSTIKKSRSITDIFNTYASDYYQAMPAEQRETVAEVEAQHVDGSMNAMTRQEKLQWLKETNVSGRDCHILTNVRCLSEGVDVPALDAIIFLSSRNSQVDVVQSVGRVMRRASAESGYDKKYGYIIIPVVVPSNVEPEDALAKSKDFGIVWDVLNALRAHDDRFDAHINKIELNGKKSDKILVGGTPGIDGSEHGSESVHEDSEGYGGTQTTLYFSELQGAIYAKMVKKVGTRRYWEQWAGDVAEIARRHKERILSLIADGGVHAAAFQEFMTGLHKNINPNISQEEAVDMLAQHLITQPVFEALFENYSFVKNNPISQSMNRILQLLDEQAMDKDRETLDKFYDAVKKGCAGITTSEGKQKIILELYDKFFKIALPTTTSKLGIVYTPVPVVDFILRSVDGVLQREFRRHLTDENIHVLDPFTGTGTFIVRLLQLGLIKPADLVRKYTQELHANEIVLLAYYIASINIENAFHDIAEQEDYTNFDGICLTDTFQLGEKDGSEGWFSEAFPVNSQRVINQKKAPIRVIVGNPPYSVGQTSANDNAQNEHYPHLEQRIAETYVAGTNAKNKNALYDSYVKAFRWASDRIAEQREQGGIIAFISNAGWLDGAAMGGMRACLEKEFSSIYVFNLRGNQRTQGETSRREGGKIFGSGSRTPTAITLLVHNPKAQKEKADIFYHDIGDYLTREEKLAAIEKFGTVTNRKMDWKALKPDATNDWLNQRSEVFEGLLPMEPKKKFDKKAKTVFVVNSRGFETGRDVWIYNFSQVAVQRNTCNMVEFYNAERMRYAKASGITREPKNFVSTDESKISWTSSLLSKLKNNIKVEYKIDSIRESVYRPFCKQVTYTEPYLIHRFGQMKEFFPTVSQENLLICVSGVGGSKNSSIIITDKIADVQLQFNGQCFPLYYYEPQTAAEFSDGQNLFAADDQQQYVRHDGITDFALQEARELYGKKVTKEDIFYYVYGFLHLPRYREQFAADLKKSLPRILFVEEAKDFQRIQSAGRQLADLHLHYEEQPAPEGVVVEGDAGNYLVDKLRFPAKDQRDTILYNNDITIRNIPPAVYDYVVNGRSPVEWIFDRYQVTVDKKSGIRNDPNDWAREHNKPRYILDLLLSVMTVSLKTQEIVAGLPDVKFE